MENEKKQKKERTLKDFFEILLPKWWIILIVSVLGAGAMFLFSYTKTDTYTSSAKFLVFCADSDATLYKKEMAIDQITYYQIAASGDDFREDVAKAARESGISLEAAQFKSMFSFVPTNDQPSFTIRITHTDPIIAYKVATITAGCIEDLVKDIEGIKDNDDGLLDLTDSPKIPAVANSKNEVRNALIGFIVGFVLSAGVILLFAISDVVIRDKQKIEDNFDIPVLGVIPYHDIEKETQAGHYGSYGGPKRNA